MDQLINITYYTDPLCCWSYAMESQWQSFIQLHQQLIRIRYVMGGLIPDWNHYHDTEQSVTRPIQMGPVWLHAAHVTGVPINSVIWKDDPPASSYPACIAYLCVQMQDADAAHAYLHALRTAVMVEGINIAKKDALIDLAATHLAGFKNFRLEQFSNDLVSEKGIAALNKDLQETQLKNVQRFPTFLFSHSGRGLLLTGYNTAEQLEKTLEKMMVEMTY